MLCVFDNNSLQYMLEQFPRSLMESIWNIFETYCINGTIISERQAQKRLELEAVESETLEWLKKRSALFQPINEKEAEILGVMMKSGELDFYNDPQIAERRLPEGVPFILCMAKAQDRYYVYRKNTTFLSTILKICKNQNIKHIEVEEYFLTVGKTE